MTKNNYITTYLITIIALIAINSGCNKKSTSHKTITINSNPKNCAVWCNTQLLGSTNNKINIPINAKNIRISQMGYQDQIIPINSQNIPKTIKTKLKPICNITIQCTSTPENAQLFINGELFGNTPITIAKLTTCETINLTFKKEGFQQVEQNLYIIPEETQYPIYAKLESTTEKFYQQKIANSPTMPNYIDLTHYYMINQKFPQAINTLKLALQSYAKNPRQDSKRLKSEIQRICTAQYEYGNQKDILTVNKMLAKVFDEFIKAQNDDNKITLIPIYITVLRASGEKRKAAELIIDTLQKYPDNPEIHKYLHLLRRQRQAIPKKRLPKLTPEQYKKIYNKLRKRREQELK